jgi:hypothetical protein
LVFGMTVKSNSPKRKVLLQSAPTASMVFGRGESEFESQHQISQLVITSNSIVAKTTTFSKNDYSPSANRNRAYNGKGFYTFKREFSRAGERFK